MAWACGPPSARATVPALYFDEPDEIALAPLAEALEQWRALPADRVHDSLMRWGEYAEYLSDRDQIVYFRRAATIADTLGDAWLHAEMLREVSSPYRHLDSIAQSFEVLYRAVDIAERGDSTVLARLHHKLAYNFLYFDDYEQAVEQLLLARRYAFRFDDTDGKTRALYTLATLYERLGDDERLERYAHEYFDVVNADPALHRGYQATAYLWIGVAAAKRGRPQVARAYFDEGYRMAASDGGGRRAAKFRLRCAMMGSAAFDPTERLRRADELLGDLRAELYPEEVGPVVVLRAEALADLGRHREARATLDTLPRLTSEDLDEAAALRERRLRVEERVAAQLGDFEAAYRVRVAFDLLRGERANRQRAGHVAYAEARHALEAYRARMTRLEADRDAHAAAASVWERLGVASGLLLVVAVLAVVILVRQRALVMRNRALLQRRVDAQTADLLVRNEELERFNTVLSHDLREPLRSVVSFSELARRLSHDPQVVEYLGYVEQGGKQLSALIADILRYQGEGLGAPVGDGATARLGDLCAELVAEQRQRRGRREIELSLVGVPADAAVPERLLRDCLGVVFDNGVTFNESPVARLTVQYLAQGDQRRVLVSDNGIGIEREYREHVFELFRRLHVREAYPGSGLGLALLRKLLRRAGGDARIAGSTLGGGTTVELAWRHSVATGAATGAAASSRARSRASGARVS